MNPGSGRARSGMVPRDNDAALESACPLVASYGANDMGAKKAVRRLGDSLSRFDIRHGVKL